LTWYIFHRRDNKPRFSLLLKMCKSVEILKLTFPFRSHSTFSYIISVWEIKRESDQGDQHSPAEHASQEQACVWLHWKQRLQLLKNKFLICLLLPVGVPMTTGTNF
jgi:hypothetical protein